MTPAEQGRILCFQAAVKKIRYGDTVAAAKILRALYNLGLRESWEMAQEIKTLANTSRLRA